MLWQFREIEAILNKVRAHRVSIAKVQKISIKITACDGAWYISALGTFDLKLCSRPLQMMDLCLTGTVVTGELF